MSWSIVGQALRLQLSHLEPLRQEPQLTQTNPFIRLGEQEAVRVQPREEGVERFHIDVKERDRRGRDLTRCEYTLEIWRS